MDDRHFDQKTAQDWIRIAESATTPLSQDIHSKLKDWIDRIQSKSVLEIGCGQGRCSTAITLPGIHYTGVEPSAFLIERAKELYANTHQKFMLGNAYDLPVPEASFDSVFSVLVWHLLNDIQKASQELSRILSASGNFLIITANPNGYPAWKSLYTQMNLSGSKLTGQMQLSDGSISEDVLYLHSFEEMKEAFQNAGLEILSTESFRPAQNLEGEDFLIAIYGKKISRANVIS